MDTDDGGAGFVEINGDTDEENDNCDLVGKCHHCYPWLFIFFCEEPGQSIVTLPEPSRG